MMLNLSKLLHISLGITEYQLERLIQRSPNTYKTYAIPKRSGGYRTIAQPAKETKFIQKWLIENVFSTLAVHECATAYKKGASIKANVLVHVSNSYIAKFDFSNFFSSIKYEHVLSFLTNRLSDTFDANDISKMAQASCIKHVGQNTLCLSVGAPSSPMLSNAIMFEFDDLISSWAAANQLSYTRYADDLTFSTNAKGSCLKIEAKLREVIADLEHVVLTLNDQKTVHLSKKFQRRVTGLVINNQAQISLGRDRKREISALIHKFSLNRLPDDDIYRLQGLLGFASDVEPDFIVRMNQKYGNQLLHELFQKRTQKLGPELGLWAARTE
ncbi:retron St85 family RNA-directed DNA polymerase [Massilia sp. CCM 9210]|uniref:retron St85 family RNA-directed DNA polymerase n=1 Tax=Massilia scottii TaxID=3057166 RepID=UPI002796DF2B|nr:retron St85 family RNA-directed DNA polymerase [Massilia sp. CCM 9210]MDQ1811732.1 retron St85 family RNA-directed DNA polymerase [Massilia sp. CCM 9210]